MNAGQATSARSDAQAATLEELTNAIAPKPVVSLTTAEGVVLGRVYADVDQLTKGVDEAAFRIEQDGALTWVSGKFDSRLPWYMKVVA